MFHVKGFKPTLVVCINEIWAENVKCGNKYLLENLARGCWPIGDSDRARDCEWLMAIANRQVRGIWRIVPDSWKKPPTKEFFALRPPSFDWKNMQSPDPKRHLRYLCDVKPLTREEQGQFVFPCQPPKGFRFYGGEIGYINI